MTRMTGFSLFDSEFWGILREPRTEIIIHHRDAILVFTPCLYGAVFTLIARFLARFFTRKIRLLGF